jgi:hypothetical protein
MEEKFNDIIEKGEKIIKVYKPNKKKFWWFVAFCLFWSSIWAVVMLILSLTLPEEWLIDEGGNGKIPMLIISIGWIASSLISLIFPHLYYKNKYYCYTDRRVIVRSGVFGVDFASLEFKSLTATMVSVSLLDKILRTNTGTIRFGSASSQMTNVNGASTPYAFRHIEKPYEVMREIKERINKDA